MDQEFLVIKKFYAMVKSLFTPELWAVKWVVNSTVKMKLNKLDKIRLNNIQKIQNTWLVWAQDRSRNNNYVAFVDLPRFTVLP